MLQALDPFIFYDGTTQVNGVREIYTCDAYKRPSSTSDELPAVPPINIEERYENGNFSLEEVENVACRSMGVLETCTTGKEQVIPFFVTPSLMNFEALGSTLLWNLFSGPVHRQLC